MRFLERERATLERLLPGLDAQLAAVPLGDLEKPGNPGLTLFRDAGGPSLVIPEDCKGLGAGPLDAVRVQRAIGSRSPSLAVATTMHHFSVAGLVHGADGGGNEWLLLEAIAAGNLLVASGFAEGRSDGRILEPTMAATVVAGGVRLDGNKRPCSLARSMDLLTASIRLPEPDGSGTRLAVALIPATDPGVTVTPFWSSFALAGAESDQVTVRDVLVPDNLVIRTDLTEGGRLDGVQTAGFVWFELLMTSSYLGAASAVVERVLALDAVADNEKLRLVSAVEGAMSAVENLARAAGSPEGRTPDDIARWQQDLLAEVLLIRYAAQDTIAAVVPRAVELLGGMSFITSDDVGYLSAAVHGLGFHPPARAKMAGPLMRFFAGTTLEIA